MAKKLRTAEQAAQNWVDRSKASNDFWKTRAGEADWQGPAGSAEAEANYSAGVTAAATNKTRQKQIQKTSNEVFHAGVDSAVNKRLTGIDAGSTKQAAAITKILQAEATIVNSLKPRGIAGSATNEDRMLAITRGLHKSKGSFKAVGVAKKAS